MEYQINQYEYMYAINIVNFLTILLFTTNQMKNLNLKLFFKKISFLIF